MKSVWGIGGRKYGNPKQIQKRRQVLRGKTVPTKTLLPNGVLANGGFVVDFVLENFELTQVRRARVSSCDVRRPIMESLIDSVVLPGDVVLDINADIKTKIIVGPGLRVSSNKVIVTKCGILHKKKPNTYWVDSHQKRYVPARGETVVGVVTNKVGDFFKVDIGSSEQAQLSYLAFEGATKKIRPMLNVGDVVYAKLVVANRDLEPELVCVDSHGKKGKLGILSPDGFMFNCSLNLVRKILNPKCPLLDTFQRTLQMPFEIAAGMNGNIWIKAKNIQNTIAVANAILAAENKTDDEIKELCENIGNILAGFV